MEGQKSQSIGRGHNSRRRAAIATSEPIHPRSHEVAAIDAATHNPSILADPNALSADAAQASRALSQLFNTATSEQRLPSIEEALATLEEVRMSHMASLANACVLLASGLNLRDTAIMTGLTQRTLRVWSKLPAFRTAVQDCFNAHAASIYNHAILDQRRRTMRLASRLDLLDEAVEARAERFSNDPNAPEEAQTGLFEENVIINARTGETITKYRLDAALMREMREIEKQAAIETGQWQETDAAQGSIKLYASIDVSAVLGQKQQPNKATVTE